MTWQKLEDSFHGHPKFRKLARRLGVPLAHASGIMALIWTWTQRMAPDGDLSSFTSEDIADAAEYEGDPAQLIKALLEVKLFDGTPEDFVVHEWMERAESYKNAQSAAKSREKKKANRSGKHTASGDGHVTVSGRGEERRREETEETEEGRGARARARKTAPPPQASLVVVDQEEPPPVEVMPPLTPLEALTEGWGSIIPELKVSLPGRLEEPWREREAEIRSAGRDAEEVVQRFLTQAQQSRGRIIEKRFSLRFFLEKPQHFWGLIDGEFLPRGRIAALKAEATAAAFAEWNDAHEERERKSALAERIAAERRAEQEKTETAWLAKQEELNEPPVPIAVGSDGVVTFRDRSGSTFELAGEAAQRAREAWQAFKRGAA